MELVIPPDEYAKMAKGTAYTLHPVNSVAEFRWKVKDGLTITRAAATLEK